MAGAAQAWRGKWRRRGPRLTGGSMHPGSKANPQVAGFRLLHRIGQGGHGTVYRAEDAAGLPLALKLVALPSGSAAAAAREAFLHGAQTAQRLVHPGIVALRAFGIEGARGWLAMELVPGTDLEPHTRPGHLLPERQVLGIAQRISQALDYAHGQGVVHRDLKPANVLLDVPGNAVKLADFGLARSADALQTATGIVPGSPGYMAPEQLAGGVPTPQSDLYAMGVMLFQLLAGRLPYETTSMGELLRQVAYDPAPDLRLLRPTVGPGVAQLVGCLLAKRASERPADARILAIALHQAAAGLPIAT